MPNTQTISIVDSQSFSLSTRLFAANLYSSRDHWQVQNALCNFTKFHYIVDGQLSIVANGERFILNSGDFLILPAGTKHDISLIDDKKCLLYFADVSLHFDDNEFLTVLDTPYFVRVGLTNEMFNIFEDIIGTLSVENNHLISVKQSYLISKLLLVFFEHCDDTRMLERKPQQDAVYQTIDFIKQHYTEKLTVKQLAQMAFLSTTYYSIRFKSLTGLSPIQYVNSLRIKKAQELLETTDMSLNEIVDTINFGDLAQFCKAFKKYCGHTPTKYRNFAKNSTVLENNTIQQTRYGKHFSTNKNNLR